MNTGFIKRVASRCLTNFYTDYRKIIFIIISSLIILLSSLFIGDYLVMNHYFDITDKHIDLEFITGIEYWISIFGLNILVIFIGLTLISLLLSILLLYILIGITSIFALCNLVVTYIFNQVRDRINVSIDEVEKEDKIILEKRC